MTFRSAFKFTVLGTFLIGGTFLAPNVYAQDRITRGELEQFYQNLTLKEASLMNFKPREVTEEQLDLLIEQIMEHYDHRYVSKGRGTLVYNGQLKNTENFKSNYQSYKNRLETVFEAPQNLEAQHFLERVDLKGQRANVDVVYNVSMDLVPDRNDMIEGSIHINTEATCKDQLTKDDGQVKLLLRNCREKALVTNVDLKFPDHMDHIDPEYVLDRYPWY